MLNWRDPANPLAGGAERVTLGYLEALADRGHEVFWFTHAFPGCLPEETLDGVRLIRKGGVMTSMLAARRWYHAQPRMDLIIDQHHGVPWYAPWWSQTPCISYIHEVLGSIWNSFYPEPIASLGRFQERWTHWLYRNHPFWTASTCTRDRLIRHGAHDVTLIPYGVNTRALPELPVKGPFESLKLVVTSRLAPNKRIDHAIRVVKLLLDRGLDVHLEVIGQGEERDRLETLCRSLRIQDQVAFLGWLEEKDKEARLQAAHFLLHTSQREGWGLNVIEANAMGTPCAVYPVDGLVESTLRGETGIVSHEETPEALANEILYAIDHPEEYALWREKAWKRADTFHWSRVLPRACDWLETMATRHHSPRQTHNNTGIVC